MLDALEARLTAVVGDALAARAHLAVLQGPDAEPDRDAGEGVVRVALATADAEDGFAIDRLRLIEDGATASRRVLPLALRLTVAFALRPIAPAGTPDLGASRQRLLADMSALGHALDGPDAADGSLFRPVAPDPGYLVRRFTWQEAAFDPAPDGDGRLTGRWHARLLAEVWPVGVSEAEGLIDAIDIAVIGQPLRIAADRARLRTGEQTEIRVASLPPDRLETVDTGARRGTRLAIGVISDLPPADRGRVVGGDAGAVAGFRLIAVDAGSGAARFGYAAPTGDLGTVRAESVAIHLATPEGGIGTLIGGLSIGLLPGAGGGG